MSIPPISKRKQTRRAISLSEREYQRLKRIALAQGVSGTALSATVEELISAFFDGREPNLDKPDKGN